MAKVFVMIMIYDVVVMMKKFESFKIRLKCDGNSNVELTTARLVIAQILG